MRVKYLLLLGLMFLFTDCQKDEVSNIEKSIKKVQTDVFVDDDVEQIANEYSGLIVESLSFEDIQNEEAFASVNQEFGGVDDYIASETETSFKDDAKKRKFKIIKEGVNVVRGEDFTTYTFRVRRKGNNEKRVIENLVLKNADYERTADLIKYKPSRKWLKENRKIESTFFEGKARIKRLTKIEDLFDDVGLGKSSLCPEIFIMYTTCQGNCGGGMKCNHTYFEGLAGGCNVFGSSLGPKKITRYVMVPCVGSSGPTGTLIDTDQGITVCGGGSRDGGSFACPDNLGGGGYGESTSSASNLDDRQYFEDEDDVILVDIKQKIAQDPFFLYDIKCSEIKKWKDVANSDAPQSVVNKIEMLNQNYPDLWDNWAIQELTDANGTITSMDYFAVNISKMPTNPMSGNSYKPNELLDYFRRNINDFTDENSNLGSRFEPYCEIAALCPQETNLWNSNDPVNALIYIDLGVPDDGSVICTESSSNHWRFKTIRAPWSGKHPVSGTREFGIEQNPDGTYNLYTRGVDRMKSNFIENMAILGTLGNPFFGADGLWELMQSNLSNFINANNGNATEAEPIILRPNWSDIEDILNGTKPISSLGCKK